MLSNRFRGITFWHPARELLRTPLSRTSENTPSRDCLEIPNGHRFGSLRACPMGRKGASRQRFALPNPRRPIPPAIFQTVSLGTSVNKGKKNGRGSYAPALTKQAYFLLVGTLISNFLLTDG